MYKLLVPFCGLFLSLSSQAEMIEINGVELEYEIKGSGEHVVVFEAGAVAGMSGFDPVWTNLPENITAVRYSRRGEGDSGACKGDLSVNDYVDDYIELLKKLKINEPHILVSHSYGGKVARAYPASTKSNLAGMLFLDPSNSNDVKIVMKVDPINGHAANEKIKAQDFEMSDGKWCWLADVWSKPAVVGFKEMGDIPITMIVAMKQYEKPRMIFHTASAIKLWGEVQSSWVKQFPRGKVILSTNTGHLVPIDQPDLVISELTSLLKRIN